MSSIDDGAVDTQLCKPCDVYVRGKSAAIHVKPRCNVSVYVASRDVIRPIYIPPGDLCLIFWGRGIATYEMVKRDD